MGDAREPRFPPAPGQGVSDYRAPQPRAAASEVIAPGDAGKKPRVVLAPVDDPLSPEAIAAFRARREAHHRRVARRGAILATVFVVVNCGVVVAVGAFTRHRIDAQVIVTFIVVIEALVFVVLARAWASRDKRN